MRLSIFPTAFERLSDDNVAFPLETGKQNIFKTTDLPASPSRETGHDCFTDAYAIIIPLDRNLIRISELSLRRITPSARVLSLLRASFSTYKIGFLILSLRKKTTTRRVENDDIPACGI